MGHNIVDSTGYPIGDLYMMFRMMDTDSQAVRDRRELFAKMGVPKERMMSVTPVLLGHVDVAMAKKIPRDYDIGLNLPEILTDT
jgi:hypothetical protein